MPAPSRWGKWTSVNSSTGPAQTMLELDVRENGAGFHLCSFLSALLPLIICLSKSCLSVKLMFVDFYFKEEIIKYYHRGEEKQSPCKLSPALLPDSSLFSDDSEGVHSSFEVLCANLALVPNRIVYSFYFNMLANAKKGNTAHGKLPSLRLTIINVWLASGHSFNSPLWRQTGFKQID